MFLYTLKIQVPLSISHHFTFMVDPVAHAKKSMQINIEKC